MNSNRREKLYNAITDISDAHIEEAQNTPLTKKKTYLRAVRSFAAIAAVFVLIFVGVFAMSRNGMFDITGEAEEPATEGALENMDTDIYDDAADDSLFDSVASPKAEEERGTNSFMSYAGPVFPLTLSAENNSITAERNITYDFELWKNHWVTNEYMVSKEYYLSKDQYDQVLDDYKEIYPGGGEYQSSNDVIVTDEYILSNTFASEQKVSVLYPFVSSLIEMEQNKPVLKSNGTELNTTLRIGDYAGSFRGVSGSDVTESVNLEYPNSWEDYKQLLSDGTYLEKALSEWPDLSDTDVIVYEFTYPLDTAESDYSSNTEIHAIYNFSEEKTTVLSYGFNGGIWDEGYMDAIHSIPRPFAENYGEPCYLIVIGEDIKNLKTKGDVTVERYETDLDDALRSVTKLMYEDYIWGEDVDYEMYHGAFVDYLQTYGVLSSDPKERYEMGMLIDIEADSVERVCYLECEVTIPAGGTVKLTAEMIKEASFDYHSTGTGNEGIRGYDMTTQLGTNLDYSNITAVIIDHGEIEIVNQNFGFDLENDVKTVTLDQSEEHWYLEVKQKI